MKTTTLLLVLSLPAFAQDSAPSTRCAVKDNPKQEFFLIDHSGGKAPAAGYKLLLVLPGGDGAAEFNPFVTNLGKQAAGEEFLLAQLISVMWTPDQQIIWPTARTKADKMKFTTEDFIRAVISDVKRTRKIDAEHIYTLSWSSGGPAAYAAALTIPEIKGSFVAMSVFKPDTLPSLSKAKGHRFYIYHSPDDRVCPMPMAEDAKERLTRAGAAVELVTYAGGHGWHGDVFGDLRKGLDWLGRR